MVLALAVCYASHLMCDIQHKPRSFLQASMYLNKLPVRFAHDDRVLLCDPMIATGRQKAVQMECLA